jgi:hypothetical protein
LELSAKTTDLLGDLTTVGVGVLAWMRTSTKKFGTYTSLKAQFEDAAANTVGAGIVKQMDSSYAGPGKLQPAFFGWANKTTGAGIALGIADWIVAEVYPPYTKDFDGLRKIVQGAATGLVVGGAIGGIFDPEPGIGGMNYAGMESGTPDSASYVNACVSHNRSAVGGT